MQILGGKEVSFPPFFGAEVGLTLAHRVMSLGIPHFWGFGCGDKGRKGLFVSPPTFLGGETAIAPNAFGDCQASAPQTSSGVAKPHWSQGGE